MTAQVNQNSVLDQFVDRANSLYTLPAVAVEVLELTSEETVDTRALKQCVERDPAMTGKLLRVVNSSLFGLSREVSDLNQALALLGVKPLKLMVLGFSLPKTLFSGLEAKILQRFWKRTLVKAVAARELSQTFWGRAGDEAFIAGLLQELGVLVLIQQLGPSYVRFLDQVFEQKGDLPTHEQETLGFHHAVLSARLLEHWKLPASIVQGVATSHDAKRISQLDDNQKTLPQILHLASLFADILVGGRESLMAELLETATEYRDVDLQQLQDLLDQLQDRVELLADVFSVRMDKQQRYREILEQAHQQMAAAAEDALPEMVATTEDNLVTERQQLSQALEQFQSRTSLPPDNIVSPLTPRGSDLKADVTAVQQDIDPGLLGRLAQVITACRRTHQEVSLALLEVEDYEGLLLSLGAQRTSDLMRSMSTTIYANTDHECDCLMATDSRYAVILPQCDRQQSVTTAKRLLEEIPRWAAVQTDGSVDLQCTAGIATLAAPSANFPPQNLVDAAERCLFASQASGGRIVKSIDLW
jgi:HD-like signal output (HDOD) protein/GGDEF domain-containing protein